MEKVNRYSIEIPNDVNIRGKFMKICSVSLNKPMPTRHNFLILLSLDVNDEKRKSNPTLKLFPRGEEVGLRAP